MTLPSRDRRPVSIGVLIVALLVGAVSLAFTLGLAVRVFMYASGL